MIDKPRTSRRLARSFRASLAAMTIDQGATIGLPVGEARTGTGSTSDSLIPAAAVREDLEFLYRTLKAAHYDLFARTSQDRYDREYLRVMGTIDQPMRRLDVIRLFTSFVAFGNIAHAHLDFPSRNSRPIVRRVTVLPLELRILGDLVGSSLETRPTIRASTPVLRCSPWMAARPGSGASVWGATSPPTAHT